MTSLLSTQLLEGDDPRIEIEEAEVRVIGGPSKGARHVLGPDRVLIGSDPECELVLDDSTVSARHAEISAGTNGYVIRDLGSTNGVLVGTQPIERAPLIDGSKLRLGKSTLEIRALGRTRTIPLSRAGRHGRLVAYSAKMRALSALVDQLAASDITVLIEGETGAGKEVVVEALHERSARARGPLVIFDCGSVAPTLLASELFGHERGAFTGAEVARAGQLEQAEGGTLFLDEIAELPLELQPAILGALERRSSRRVGGEETLTHDVRIVAATHRNLAHAVRAKQFREDLYFRLAVGRVKVPPLRERREDVLVLADLFAEEAGAQLSPEARALLLSYEWPGNVRELRNVIQRLAAAPRLPLRDALDGGGDSGPFPTLAEARRGATERFEREYLEALWRVSGENMLRATELAETARQHLSRLLDCYGIRPIRRDDEP